MLYNVATITVAPGSTPHVLGKLEAGLATAGLGGELLACWFCDIGALNQILVIRSYPDARALEADRRILTMQPDPIGIGELVTGVTMDVYAPFSFLEPMRPGRNASIFEVRTYVLKPGGLGPTIESWQKALPERLKLSPLLAAMHTLTGPMPRFMHIWPYGDLVERQRIRTKAVETGVWPPRGGPGRLLSQQTDIYLPAKFSPIA